MRLLLWLPGGLMMSSNYDLSRLYPLWRRLSVSRIRWIALAGVLLLTIPVLLWYRALAAAGEDGQLIQAAAVAGLVLLPLLWEALPERARRRVPFRESRAELPNVLMIGCDTLRADVLGCLGNGLGLTPFLDTLAARGTAFSRCYTPVARTAPSLAAWLTGRWPHRLGIRDNFVSDAMTRVDVPTLASVLGDAGYETAVISDWSGGDFGKFTFGFGDADVPPDQWNLRYLIRQGPKDIRLFLTLFTHSRFGRTFLPELYYLAGVPVSHHLVAKACGKVDALAATGKPWLLNVFLGTAHPPFASRYPYYTLYGDAAYNGASRFAMAKLTDPFEIIRSQREPRQSFDLDQILALYYGCVRAFDDEVREIVQHVQRRGLAENTLIVVYSDHGMEFFEHQTWGQGNSVLGSASNRVPLLIVDPRGVPSQVRDEVVRTVDLLPTLLELCSLGVPKGLDGVSLAETVRRGAPVEPLTAFFETGVWLATPPGQHAMHVRYPEILDLLDVPDHQTGTICLRDELLGLVDSARDRAVVEGNWKLVYTPCTDRGRYALFDMRRQDLADLAPHHPERTAAMRQKLVEWMNLAGETPV
jgi:arylsulfatase A-like enzyme